MKNFKFTFILAAVIALAASCTPKESNTLYMCGDVDHIAGFYTINHEIHYLDLLPGTKLGDGEFHVNDILVHNGDVYCCGYLYLKFYNENMKEMECNTGMVWKNETPILVVNTHPDANRFVGTEFNKMELLGDDLYIVGSSDVGEHVRGISIEYYKSAATIWKYNLNEDDLDTITLSYKENEATDIYIDENNGIHITGTGGMCWSCIDGKWGSKKYNANRLDCIFGSQGKIYVGGYKAFLGGSGLDTRARYYTSTDDEGTVVGIMDSVLDGAVIGEDLYMCGNIGNVASCNKNDEILTMYPDDYEPLGYHVYAMDCKGEDIYVAGYRGKTAGYWKNFKFRSLNLAGGTVKGIVVL